jgi:hypothetical protein
MTRAGAGGARKAPAEKVAAKKVGATRAPAKKGAARKVGAEKAAARKAAARKAATSPAGRRRKATRRGVGEWPRFVEATWADTHRLILATYADRTEPYLAALTDPAVGDADADVAALVELSAVTNTRLAAQRDVGTLAIGADELVFRVDHARIVNAAFTHPGLGARFSDRTRGAWYCSVEVDTCLAEVAHHRRLHLAETDWWHDTVDYQDYVCTLGGPWFADLRDGDPRSDACLDPSSHVASQQLAVELLDADAAGVVYPSVRHAGGVNVACFRPALLPPVAAGGRYRLAFTGTPDPAVEVVT